MTSAQVRRAQALKRPLLPYSEQPYRVALPLGLTAIFFLFLFLVLRPYYLTNDDGYTTLVAMGFDQPDHQSSSYLLNTNVLVARLIQWLVRCFGDCNWYGVLLLACLCLAGWIIADALYRRRAWAGLAFLAILEIHYFTHMEFTLQSFFLAAAGILLIFIPSATPKRLAAGTGFVFISSLIRPEAVLLAGSAMLPWVLEQWRSEPSGPRIRKGCLLAGLGILIFGALALNRHHWVQDPAGREVAPYIKTLHGIVEYRGLKADAGSQELLASVGWDSLDFAMYANRDWDDPLYSLERSSRLLEQMGPVWSGKGFGWAWIFHGDFMRFQLFCLLSLALFLGGTDRRRFLLNSLWVFGIFLGLYYGMKTNEWVAWPLFSILAFLGFLGGPKAGPGTPGLAGGLFGSRAVILLLALLCAATLIHSEFLENREAQTREASLQEDLRALLPGNDHLYVVWNRGLPMEAVGVLGNYAAFKDIPVYWMNDWQRDPDSLEILRQHGLTDPLREIVNRKDCYLILPDYYHSLLGYFVREKLRMEPSMTLVFQGKTFNIYQIKGKPLVPGRGGRAD
jgi:hypothetical protein